MTPSGPKNADRQPRLFRAESVSSSLGIYLPSIFAARVLGLARNVILAWLITRAEFGLLQIALLAITVLHPFCSAGLHEAVTRYVPQYETRHALRAFLIRVLPTCLAVAAILSAAAYIDAERLGRYFFERLQTGELVATSQTSITLTRAAVCVTFALVIYFLLLGILKGLRMFRAVSLFELAWSAGFTLLAVVVAWSGWQTAYAVVVCYGLTLAAAVLVFLPGLVRAIRHADNQNRKLAEVDAEAGERPLIDRMVRFSLWAALAAVMWQSLQYFPMWCLHKISGPDVTAVFGGMRVITQIVLIGAVAVVTVVQTSVTKTWESRGHDQADRQWLLAFKSAAILLLVACATLAASRDLLIRIFPGWCGDGAAIIPLLLLFFLIGGHLSFLGIHFSLIERASRLFVPWLAGVCFSVLAGFRMVMSDLGPAEALNAAAWVGIAGISAALATCLLLIVWERRPLDLGAWVLILGVYALALPIYHGMLPVVGLVLVAAAGTGLVFSRDEKRELRERLLAGRDRVRRLLGMRSS